MLEVCVVGLGAVGALYGFVLEKSGSARVTAVCRSNYERVKSRGVAIRSEKFGDVDAWHPFRVVTTTGEAADREYDYVVCAAKFIPDVTPTSRVLGPLLSRTSTFVLLQNGIGIHEELRGAVRDATILSACAWVDATAVDGGNVIIHGRMDRLDLGIHWPSGDVGDAVRGASRERLNAFVAVLVAGGCHAIAVEEIEAARWQKNLWNIGYSVFCTLTGASVTTLLEDKWVGTTTAVVRGFIDEAVSVARGTGIEIGEAAIRFVEDTTLLEHAESHPLRGTVPISKQQFKPSMLVDLEAGRAMEVEGIVGGVVRRGRAAGMAVPRLETAYATLTLMQAPLLVRARSESG